MLRRVYPIFISALGILGLTAALSYLGGAYLAFEPGWEAWAEFFVPLALPLLVVPHIFLLGHLYLRARLGGWFLAHGFAREAIEYCEPRLSHNLLRGRNEALTHRICLARAHIYLGEYQQAAQVLSADYKAPRRGKIREEIARWQMEIALRQEDLVSSKAAWDEVAGPGRAPPKLSELHACRAELAAREGEREAFERALELAKWRGEALPRVRLVELLGVLKFSARRLPEDERRRLLKTWLDGFEEFQASIVAEIPGREAELMALHAELFYRNSDHEQAAALLAEAESARADRRAEFVLEQTRAAVAEASG